jgi:hypothetical protein
MKQISLIFSTGSVVISNIINNIAYTHSLFLYTAKRILEEY